MSKKKIKTTFMNNKIIFVPIVLLVIFLALAVYSRQKYLGVVYREGFHPTQYRKSPLNYNYSDIAITIDIEEINPEASSITVSFFIRGWFTENYTNFWVSVQNFVSPHLDRYLNISNHGGGGPRFFYQIEDGDRGPYLHGVWGYTERFPYDYYLIRYDFGITNIDPDLKFPPNFDPSVGVYIPSGWSIESFIRGTETDQSSVSINRQIDLVLSRSGNRISFYSSSFLFTFFEYLIIGSLIFIPSNKKNLSQRMIMLLTSSALVLTFYNTFMTKLALETISYIQVFFVSVIFSNMILLAFSILDTFYWSKQIDDFKVFDLLGLLLTSITPLVLFFIYVFFLLSPEFTFLWSYYLDYRFMLWLAAYVPIIWVSLKRKNGLLFVVTGFTILLFQIFDMAIQKSDIFLLSFSVLMLFLGTSILIQKHVKSILAFTKKLFSRTPSNKK